MSGQEIGYVGYSPDYKSKKPTYQDLCKKSWDLRHTAGYRAGVEAMRDATIAYINSQPRPSSLQAINSKGRLISLANKLLGHKENE